MSSWDLCNASAAFRSVACALLSEACLIGVLLDDEQEVPGFDLLALGEGPLLQEALDARHQIDRVDRLDTSDKRPGGSHAL
jgi:hypothetical protein